MSFIGLLKKYISAFMFGMKAGDEIFTTSNNSIDGGNSVTQKAEQDGVLNDLLQGEVTQEVEELRYETFKAEELSNEYQYIGNGQAVKKSGDSSIKRKNFYQYNFHQEYGFNESMSMIASDELKLSDIPPERSIFNIEYDNPCVRFKIENYLFKIKVDLSSDKYKTDFIFLNSKKDRKKRPFLNFAMKTIDEIGKFSGDKLKYKSYIQKNELLSSIRKLSFKTFNATNDVPNGIDYIFTSPTFESISCNDDYVIITYVWKSFDGNVLLSEKFKSESAEKKFKNKERRENYMPVVDINSLSKDKETVNIRNREFDNIQEWLNPNE